MSTFDYSQMAALAEDLLGQFGQTMTLLSMGDGSQYDPHEGGGYVTTSASTVVGVILPTSNAKVRGSEGALTDFDNSSLGLADSKRRFAILKAKDSTLPQVADTITDSSGTTYKVTGVTQVAPAGVDIVWRVGLEDA
jgi:hypothetical protein